MIFRLVCLCVIGLVGLGATVALSEPSVADADKPERPIDPTREWRWDPAQLDPATLPGPRAPVKVLALLFDIAADPTYFALDSYDSRHRYQRWLRRHRGHPEEVWFTTINRSASEEVYAAHSDQGTLGLVTLSFMDGYWLVTSIDGPPRL